MTQDRIIDRIRKLYAKAEGARQLGSEAEAEAFAEKVRELLAQHKLDMSVLTDEARDAADPLVSGYHTPGGVRKKARSGWVELLADGVAKAYFCDFLVLPGSNTLVMVGRRDDVAVATYVIDNLVRFAEEESLLATRKERYRLWKAGRLQDSRGFRTSFINGFVTGIRKRLRDEVQKQVASDSRFALVLQKSQAEVAELVAKLSGGTSASTSVRRGNNLNGYRAGVSAADRANIRGNGVGSGQQPADRHLSRAPKLIGGGS